MLIKILRLRVEYKNIFNHNGREGEPTPRSALGSQRNDIKNVNQVIASDSTAILLAIPHLIKIAALSLAMTNNYLTSLFVVSVVVNEKYIKEF